MDSYVSRTNVVAAFAAISFFGLLGTMFFNRKSRSHQEDKKMASSSSLTLLAPSSSLPHIWVHNVFPSFHGADVRTNFLSHVLKELGSKGIDLFIDNDIERSKLIGPALIEAIKGSRIAIVFLSKNYASSTWCLNELVEIMKCRADFGQTVISLFYQVDPTHVKKQIGDFGKVFERTCVGKTEEEIGGWKHALTEVAQIAGYHSSNWENEAKMIEAIATDVSNKLNNFAPSSDFNGLVGMESHITEMGPLLQLDSNEVRKIGILGPVGIGKTTIARFLFNRHFEDFQLSVFMDNISRNYPVPACSDDYSVKLDLQKQFMCQLTSETCIKVPHLGVVKDRLKDKKVLIVLDDVDQLIQLEAMAKETCWFGPGSRIVITTQNQKILKASGIIHIYKVNLPSNDAALQMFCMYAFGQKDPKDGFEKLACEVRSLVGRLPLGLRVMGSYFRGMSEKDWIETLPRLRTHLNRDGEIASILEFSYDSLRDEDKSLFLHLACFFHYGKVDIVEGCLAKCFLDVRHGLHVLAEKSLISMDSGRTNMSNLLIQLGRKIMREQSDSDPGNRQFLNDAIDVGEVLIDDKPGISSVIGRDLDEKITFASERSCIRLSNLQFLRTKRDGVNLQSMNYISRKLSWPMFQMTCFPSSFNPTFQIKLEMPFSNLEKLWGDTKPLNLKWMELSYSHCLKELPDFSTATNLYELDFTHDSSLVNLSSSIGNAISLQNLNLSHCSNLVEIPSSVITNLKSLDFYGYTSLVELPFNIEKVIDSIYINLGHCSTMVELPSSIENAINLQELNLNDCSSPVELPFSIGNALYLQKLNMSYCSRLVKLPSSIGNIVNFEEQDLDHCSSLVELPSPVSNLGRLSELELKECSKLEVLLASINLETLGEVTLSDWSLLKKSYPESSTDVQEIDPWVERISGLRELVQSGMEKLESLPQLPDSLWELDADNGEPLERLGISFSNPDINLSFLNYFKLNQEEKDHIIQTQTSDYEVFPGGEVPTCFTYQSSGSSLTVKLNQTPLGTSTKFKVCIVCGGEDEMGFGEWERASVSCSITSGGIVLSSCLKIIEQFLPGNLYTFEFEVETEELTSTELVFEFEVDYADLIKKGKTLEIKECGVMLVNMIESFGDDNSSGALDGARGSADPYQLLYFI